MFAEALRHELGGTGVSLTTVYPGEIASPCTSTRRTACRLVPRRPGGRPASGLAAKVLDGVESDARSVAHPPVVRLLGALHNTAPRASDALLRRLRGGTAAPRRD